MNAAVIYAFDPPPRYTSFAEPVAADGEVLVDVIAAGLHPIVKTLVMINPERIALLDYDPARIRAHGDERTTNAELASKPMALQPTLI
jgi:hypothetical protein